MWKAALSGDLAGISKTLLDQAPRAAPDELIIGTKKTPSAQDWRSQVATNPRWSARWSQQEWEISNDGVVVTVRAPWPVAMAAAISKLAELPFEIASFRSLHEWTENGAPYTAPSFSDGHFRHGWACAFRGAGHRRLVSKRWLEYGPWRLDRGPHDLSFVLFHDPKVDAQTALAQAKPGHARMGISDEGGFIQSEYVYQHEFAGRYLPTTREMRVMASRRDVSQREMRDACAALRHQRWDVPVETVSYVFLDEERARAHLHALWLHDLGCLTIIDGNEVRLDADYAPLVEQPAWVDAVQD